MRLNIPSEEEETAPAEESESASDGEMDDVVTILDDVMDPLDAIEMLGEMLDNPESFGLVSASQYRELADRVEQLEEENEDLAKSLRQAYSIMDRADSIGQFSLNELIEDSSEEVP